MKFKGPTKLEQALIKRGICTACRQHKDKHVRKHERDGLHCPNGKDYFTVPMGRISL